MGPNAEGRTEQRKFLVHLVGLDWLTCGQLINFLCSFITSKDPRNTWSVYLESLMLLIIQPLIIKEQNVIGFKMIAQSFTVSFFLHIVK